MSKKLENAYIETTIENWNDFFLLHQRFLARFVFRGQSNSEWKLETALERLINRLHPINHLDDITPAYYEKRMIEEFIWKYPLYKNENIPTKDEYVEWLALMQHYGSPTRMLDFSHSIFVALFMAIDGCSVEKSAIWGLNSTTLRLKIFEHYQTEHNTNIAVGNELENYIYERANKAINSSMRTDPLEKELYIVEPNICNERLNRQQGLFVIPSNIRITFEDILSELINKQQIISVPVSELIEYSNSRSGIHSQSGILLLKINIPKRLNLELTKILKQMNITAETLYPGIEGLAKSMSCLRDSAGGYNY